MNKCELCGKDTETLSTCFYCKKKVCEECIAFREKDGLVCLKCADETPRQINWRSWEIDEDVLRKQG